jgi:hypothetical protein
VSETLDEQVALPYQKHRKALPWVYTGLVIMFLALGVGFFISSTKADHAAVLNATVTAINESKTQVNLTDITGHPVTATYPKVGVVHVGDKVEVSVFPDNKAIIGNAPERAQYGKTLAGMSLVVAFFLAVLSLTGARRHGLGK